MKGGRQQTRSHLIEGLINHGLFPLYFLPHHQLLVVIGLLLHPFHLIHVLLPVPLVLLVQVHGAFVLLAGVEHLHQFHRQFLLLDVVFPSLCLEHALADLLEATLLLLRGDGPVVVLQFLPGAFKHNYRL